MTYKGKGFEKISNVGKDFVELAKFKRRLLHLH
jgi:hypothetical protein